MSTNAGDGDAEPALASNGASVPAAYHSASESFTMLEAARAKGVSYHTVSRAVRSGKLPSRRTGRMVLIGGRDLNAWSPMRERAPRKYRQRHPEPQNMPGVVELASGERAELTRRLAAVYESIQFSALVDPLDRFGQLVAERFAAAMDFDRVALLVINQTRTEIIMRGSYGTWFAPDDEPAGRLRFPYDPVSMYAAPTDVYEAIGCWSKDPAPINPGTVFTASLVANGLLVGYIIGDHSGRPFSLNRDQIELGHNLATQFAITIELRRDRDEADARRSNRGMDPSEHSSVLSQHAQSVARGDDAVSVIRQATREATRLLASHHGGVVLQSGPESITCYFTAGGVDLAECTMPFRLANLPGTLHAFNSRQPWLCSWTMASAGERDLLAASGSKSCLTIPLEVHGELAGVMTIMFRSEEPNVSSEQLELCVGLTAGCVIALSHQRLRAAIELGPLLPRHRNDLNAAD